MSENTTDPSSVSVIGLGAMGAGLAQTFLESGCRVSVWNRSRDKVEALVSQGAIACETPGDALDANTHVVVCLSTYSAWREIVEEHGLTDQLRDTCIIQLTTGTLDEVREHASMIRERGGLLADGALMCFPRQLGTSDASLLVSGDPAVLDSCDPLLRMLAPAWTNLGEDITKPTVLSRSLTAGIVTSLVGYMNGLAMCRAGGISIDLYMQHTAKANAILRAEKDRLAEAVRDGETEDTQASIETWAEAHDSVHSVASTLGTDLVLQDAVRAVFQDGQRLGLGEHDLSALVKVFAPSSS